MQNRAVASQGRSIRRPFLAAGQKRDSLVAPKHDDGAVVETGGLGGAHHRADVVVGEAGSIKFKKHFDTFVKPRKEEITY